MNRILPRALLHLYIRNQNGQHLQFRANFYFNCTLEFRFREMILSRFLNDIPYSILNYSPIVGNLNGSFCT